MLFRLRNGRILVQEISLRLINGELQRFAYQYTNSHTRIIPRGAESQKRAKTELGGLAKDWCSVLIHADSVATSSVDRIEMPAGVKSESATKKAAAKESVKVWTYLS